MCPSAPRVCSEPGGQKPVLSLSLDLIDAWFKGWWISVECVGHAVGGLVQDCGSSIALAVELPESCTKPLMCSVSYKVCTCFQFMFLCFDVIIPMFLAEWYGLWTHILQVCCSKATLKYMGEIDQYQITGCNNMQIMCSTNLAIAFLKSAIIWYNALRDTSLTCAWLSENGLWPFT